MSPVTEIRSYLEARTDEKYGKFTASLVPGCGPLLGVRLPELRAAAGWLAAGFEQDRSRFEAYAAYTLSGKAVYQEELLIHGLAIGYVRADIETVLGLFGGFMPLMTNWAVCDPVVMTLKIIKKNRARVWDFMEACLASGKTYYIRAAVVAMLDYFVTEEYLPRVLSAADSIRHDDYYVKMAVAWCISVCFVKFPEQVRPYLEHNGLDDDTFNKTIRKILESRRCPAEMKNTLRNMKRQKP